MSFPVVDAHCHLQLYPLYERVNEVIVNAVKSNVEFVCVCGTIPGEDWMRIKEITNDNKDFVIPAYGLHPWWIKRYFEQVANNPLKSGNDAKFCNSFDSIDPYSILEDQLVEAVTENPNACVGECGLDKPTIKTTGTRTGTDVGTIGEGVSFLIQELILKKHLLVSGRYSRPLILHCVGCWGKLLEILSTPIYDLADEDGYEDGDRDEDLISNIPGIVLHSANSINSELIPAFLNLKNKNIYFSFTAIGTPRLAISGTGTKSDVDTDIDRNYEKRRQKMKATLNKVPLDRLLIETDSPDQLPHDLKTKAKEGDNLNSLCSLECNEPRFIQYTLNDISNHLSKDIKEISEITINNSRRVFGFNK